MGESEIMDSKIKTALAALRLLGLSGESYDTLD